MFHGIHKSDLSYTTNEEMNSQQEMTKDVSLILFVLSECDVGYISHAYAFKGVDSNTSSGFVASSHLLPVMH